MEPEQIFKFAPIASEGNPLRMALKVDETLRTVAGQRPFAMAEQPLQRPVAATGELRFLADCTRRSCILAESGPP